MLCILKTLAIFVAHNLKIMKHVFLTALTALFVVGCTNTPPKDTMVVSGAVKGLKKGTLYLQHIADSTLVSLDSITLNGGGDFSLQAQISSPEIFYLYLDKKDNNAINDRITFFGGPGNITVTTQWNAFDANPEIKGAQDHETFMEYKEMRSKFNIKELSFMEAALQANTTNNPAALDSLQQAADNNSLRRYLFTLNFAMNHSDSYVAPYVTLTDTPNAGIKLLDSIYKKLTPEVAASKYGQQLKDLIQQQKTKAVK